ncbi:hypothetical protein ACFV9C_36180 [Kribbella sp. NPDC059898]|uniref:hypothetical protein n=1 Tax=Kribbella sp. NPDC059898 TaxID=3346995 RepID=UPI00365875E4
MLQHAIEVELDAHAQTGEPLHVDVTVYLLARGADPLASPLGGAGSAFHLAWMGGHWLAVALMEAFGVRGASGGVSGREG